MISSVLAQDHERLELVISDNASTDGTEELCRDLASDDSRIVYHRQPRNIGLLNNFVHAMRLAKGTFFRWVGDNDWLAPQLRVALLWTRSPRTVRLILVTTQIEVRRTGRDDPDARLRRHGPAFRATRSSGSARCCASSLVHGMFIDPSVRARAS